MGPTILITKSLLASFRLAGSQKEDNLQFHWHESDNRGLSGSAVFTLFIHRRLLQQTTIDVIRQHPHLFGEQSVETVSRLLTDFATSSISVLGPGTVFSALGNDQSLLDLANDDTIEIMSFQLQNYLNNSGQKMAYLLPLPEVQLSGEIVTDRLFLVPGASELDTVIGRFDRFRIRLLGNQYPPFVGKHSSWPVRSTDAWLGVFEGSHTRAESVMQAFLGALSMAMDFPKSRSFTYARSGLPKGHVAIRQDGKCTIWYRPPQLPGGLGAIAVNPPMLKMIGGLLVNQAANQKIQVALEYIAAGWLPIGRMGFLHNAIALDALFGEDRSVRKSILAGVKKHAGEIDRVHIRTKLLLDIRNQLLHGESSNVESCSEYLEYHENFDIDPAKDQIGIIRMCLWKMSGG
ncbi:MAG: hypothetical protein JSR31_01395 [Nitrospira sp.]|nr:hypothetical protein [Nitrospira sp.]